MAELFMECEEEELQPWQRKLKRIVIDDDDDELIFVGEIVSAKTASTNNLNRVNSGSSPRGIQNGSPGRGVVTTFKSPSPQYKNLPSAGTMAVAPVYQAAARPTATSVVLQPVSRSLSASGSTPSLQRPVPGSLSPQQTSRPLSGVTQPATRPVTMPVTSPPISRNAGIPVTAPAGPRPVATVTAQPMMANQGYILTSPSVTQTNSQGTMFGVQQKEIKQYPSSPTISLSATANLKNSMFANKRTATSEVNVVPTKMSKPIEAVKGNRVSTTLPPVQPATVSVSPSTLTSSKGSGAGSGLMKNGTSIPRACPKCSIQFSLIDPLKNHMKYCCPDMMNAFFAGVVTTEISSSPRYEEGKLIMLVSDFYYGKHDGDLELVKQEQKTHTTFKCFSCGKVLKNNVRFMNHMKHHLELEKQNSESWESHTTCHHCYRQFPTPFQLQCHIESSHTLYESTTICKICELSYDNEQVLLQHMKDNHKPGEMPYVCQVCSYRSSLFSDVESHFRTVHENTKALLCPFCLKVVRIGTPYMQHYMKHQKKGIYRCAKCRLQFLTSKEKMDHRTQHHRTFKKPKQLEGLPPGTKVTIRATVGSLHVESSATSPESTSSSTNFEPTSKFKNNNSKPASSTAKANTSKSQSNGNNSKSQSNGNNSKSQPNTSNSRSQPSTGSSKSQTNANASKSQPNASHSKSLSATSQLKSQTSTIQTKPLPNAGPPKSNAASSKTQSNANQSKLQPPTLKKTNAITNTKKKIVNTALKNLRNPFGAQKCIECDSLVKDFASHFITYVNCSLCRYSTSCGKAYANHMVSFHSNRASKRFSIFKKPSKQKRNVTTVCFNCDFLIGDSGLDAMAKHLSENTHSCQIVENGAGQGLQNRSKTEASFEKKLLHVEEHSRLVELNEDGASHNSKKESNTLLEKRNKGSDPEIAKILLETNKGNKSPSQNENDTIEELQKASSKEQTSEKMLTNDHAEKSDAQVVKSPKHVCDQSIVKMPQHKENTLTVEQIKENKEAEFSEEAEDKTNATFEQFLQKEKPESVCSDVSDQGSIHLEPLTPSEMLEYEATEILQKGGVSPSIKKAGHCSEQPDDIPLESSPSKTETTLSLKQASKAS
ncbi:zinc finger protein 280D isoform X1 [Pleurodeles waltl]